MFLELFQSKAPLPKGVEAGIPQKMKELLMVISVSHHCCHHWDVRSMRGQMANESVRPMLPQFLFKGPLGGWFQAPQLDRPPAPPFRQLKLGDRWRSMPRLPHLWIMMFPTIPYSLVNKVVNQWCSIRLASELVGQASSQSRLGLWWIH